MDKMSRRWRPIKERDNRRKKATREYIQKLVLKIERRKVRRLKNLPIIRATNSFHTSASSRKIEYFNKPDVERGHDKGSFYYVVQVP